MTSNRHLFRSLPAITVFALVGVLGPARSSSAAPITFTYTAEGEVDNADGSYFGLSPNDVVQFTGAFTLDDQDLAPSDSNLGVYAAPNMTVSFAGQDFDLGAIWFAVDVSSARVQFILLTSPNPSLAISLGFPVGFFADDLLPLSLPMSSVNSGENSFILTMDEGDLFIRGELTSLTSLTGPSTPTPVPEPATLALLGTSLAGLAIAQRRRQRRRASR